MPRMTQLDREFAEALARGAKDHGNHPADRFITVRKHHPISGRGFLLDAPGGGPPVAFATIEAARRAYDRTLATERRRAREAERKSTSHATKKKSSAQLEREIAEVLGVKPINRRKAVRHFSHWTDKRGRTHYAVTYEDRSGHPITREELERHSGGGGLGRSSHATRLGTGAATPYRSKYGHGTAEWRSGYDFAKESARHETRAEMREVLRGLSRAARTDYDRGMLAAYSEMLGDGPRSHSTRRHAGVEVDTSAYRRTHGAEPRGFGNWKFVIGAREYGYGDESDLYRPAEARGAQKAGRTGLSFAKAKEHAIAEAKRRGAVVVGVAP